MYLRTARLSLTKYLFKKYRKPGIIKSLFSKYFVCENNYFHYVGCASTCFFGIFPKTAVKWKKMQLGTVTISDFGRNILRRF